MNKTIVIYLGTACNQSCAYCDRDYVKKIGQSILFINNIPKLVKAIKPLLSQEYPRVHFHGGEPFLYVAQMERIIDSLPNNTRISILTNGTLLFKNVKFLKKYAEQLEISISYDFTQQKINRKYEINIFKILEVLNELNISITMLQWVMDPRDKNIFSIRSLVHIVDIYSQYNVSLLSLIPLKHHRGEELEIILDEIDLYSFFSAFIRFIDILYALNIRISINGSYENKNNKEYFDDYGQLVFAPDGYVYPEFDFFDYRLGKTATGSWLEGEYKKIKRNNFIFKDKCAACEVKSDCGLRYLFSIFNKNPSDNCIIFYTLLSKSVEHLNFLQQFKNLMELERKWKKI